jgi:O-antigen/teichoic acid export membrane protein
MKRLKNIYSKTSDLINNDLAKSTIWYTGTEFLVSGLAILTLPLFTRLLSVEQYGEVALFTTWVSITTVVISLGLLVTAEKGKIDFPDKYDELMSSIVFLSLIPFLLVLLFSSIFSGQLSRLFNIDSKFIPLIPINAYGIFIFTLTLQKLRYKYKYKIVSVFIISSSIITIIVSIFMIIFVFPNTPSNGRIIGNALPTILFGIFFLFYNLKQGKTYVNIQYWKYGLLISIPLIIHNLSSIVNSLFDRVIVNYYLGDYSTGLYSFAYNFGMIAMILLSGSNLAWSPWFFEKMKEKKYDLIKKNSDNYRDIFTLAYVVLLFISKDVYKLLANSDYWIGISILPWIFMAVYFQFLYKYEVRVEVFYGKTAMISIGTILSAILNIVLNLIFIPLFGYEAAAITTAFSYLALFIFHYYIVRKIIKQSILNVEFYVVSFMYIFISTLTYLLFQNSILGRYICLVILSTILLLIIFRRSYKSNKSFTC